MSDKDNQNKETLIAYLKTNGVGRSNAQSNNALALLLKVPERTIRKYVNEIIHDKQALIGSFMDKDNGGYFIINDDEDFEITINLLGSHLSSLAERIRKIKEMNEDRAIGNFGFAREKLAGIMANIR